MKLADLLPRLPHEGPPIPRFLDLRELGLVEDNKPGCIAADNTLTVLGYLNGLADGWKGFGVLRQGVERLEIASESARKAGGYDIADALDKLAKIMPNIRTEDEAKEAALGLKEVARRAWDLGKNCSGVKAAFPEALTLAKELQRGNITREEAIESLTKERSG